VFDTTDGTPRELFSIEGKFVTVYLPPSGKGAVLDPSGDSVDRASIFVDLELGTSRRLVGEAGELVDILEWGSDDLWFLVSFGEEEYRSSALGILEVETGTITPLPTGNTWRRVSDDGRTLLLDLLGPGDNRRCTVLDLERGTVTELDGPCPDWAVLSPDGRWVVYSRSDDVRSAKPWMLSVVETTTGKTVYIRPGKNPVWLAP
jgi:Tol biopolymer transport system component